MTERGFFKTVFGAMIQASKEWKEHRKAVKSKKDLLSAKSDFRLLEKMIQEVNNDPYLQVNIKLNDGTQIKVVSWAGREQNAISSRIDGTVYDQDGNVIFIQ